MQLIDKTITYEHTNEVFKITAIGDLHIGAKGFAQSKFSETVNHVKDDDHAYWIGMGDYVEAISIADKRFDPTSLAEKFRRYSLDDLADAEMDEFIKLADPIKDKCLGLHRGNHEEAWRLHHYRNIMNKACGAWSVPELGDSAMIRLRFVRKSPNATSRPSSTNVVIFTAHGNVAGRKSGSKVNRLEELMGLFTADIYILAHGHKKVTHTASTLSVPQSGKLKLQVRKKVGFMTGGFLRSYQEGSTCYAERSLYPPSDLGAMQVLIKPSTKEYWLGEEV